MNIYLVRHGETDWNKTGRMQGGADIPLNARGIALAEETREGMRGIPIEIIYSSPLQRAYKTARIIRGERKIPIVADERLREMGFGRYEGSSIEWARAHEEDPLYDFIRRPERYRARDGEDFEDVIARAGSFLREVLLPAQDRYENVMISSHGAWIRCFLRCIEQRPIAAFWGGIPQKNCAVTLALLKGGRLRIVDEGRLYYEEKKDEEGACLRL